METQKDRLNSLVRDYMKAFAELSTFLECEAEDEILNLIAGPDYPFEESFADKYHSTYKWAHRIINE